MKPSQLPPVSILLEDGSIRVIKSINDLPTLTTGLLEVNLLAIKNNTQKKATKDTELTSYLQDQTAEMELLYLYFLQHCEMMGIFPEDVLTVLYGIFPALVRIGTLHQIEDGGGVNKKHRHIYKEKLNLVLSIKQSFEPLDSAWKTIIQSLWGRFYHRINEDLTEYINVPMPECFQHPSGPLLLYVQNIRGIKTDYSIKGHKLSIRRSILIVRHKYRGAIEILNRFLYLRVDDDGSSTDWYTWYEKELNQFIELVKA